MVGLAAGIWAGAAFYILRQSRGWSFRKICVSWTALIVFALLLTSSGVLLFNYFSDLRGHGTGVEKILGENGRLKCVALAFEQWQDRPLFGWGSRSFSYESVRRWHLVGIPSWFGTMEMAHSEYLQTLTDYGLLGLLLLLCFVVIVFFRALFSPENLTGIHYGAIVGIVATMTHCLMDFTLHALPITILTAICFGVLMKDLSPKFKAAAISLKVLGLVAMVIVLGIVCGKDWVSMKQFYALEQTLKTEGFTPKADAMARGLLEVAPDYDLARIYGRLQLEKFEKIPERERDPGLLEGARWALEMAVERNPYDAESLGNLALVLNKIDEDERADEMYRRAIKACWKRERKFFPMKAYADFLAKQGNRSWLERKPSEAMAYFQMAVRYLDASETVRSRYRRRSDNKSFRKKWLTERIEFLEGAGITTVDLPNVPAPPVSATDKL